MLILVRHGRTQANAQGLLLGRSDPALDDVGIGQANAVANLLGDVTVLRTSPLLRTQQTAAAIAPDAVVDDRWIELNYGDWEGRPVAQISPTQWRQWASDIQFAPPGGESVAQLGVRVRSACDDLAPLAADRDVVVVTHVSPIKAAVAWALGVSDDVAWRMFVAPGSITRIALAHGRPSLQVFNEVPSVKRRIS